jgi:AbrB family looped-hinge helix DNA binding protein
MANMLSAKVSTKHQISIPSAARRHLGIHAGDRLDVAVTDDAIVLRKRPARPSDRMRGLASGKGWYGPDPVTYVRRLRDEWEERARERDALVGREPAGDTPTDRG